HPSSPRSPYPTLFRSGLDDGTVEHPRLPRTHPADRVGVDAVAEQPDARVGRGLARAHDHVLGRGLLDVDEVVDGDDAGTAHGEGRWGLAGDGGGEVVPVDNPGEARVVHLAGAPGDEAALPQPLAPRKKVDLAGGE